MHVWRDTTGLFPLNFYNLPCSRNGACTRSKWVQLSELTQWVLEEKSRCYSLKMQELRLPQLTPLPRNQQLTAELLQILTQNTLDLLEASHGKLFVGSGSHQNNAVYIWSLPKLKQNLNIMQSNYSSMGKKALKWTAHKGALLWRKKLYPILLFFFTLSFLERLSLNPHYSESSLTFQSQDNDTAFHVESTENWADKKRRQRLHRGK